ncbi:MAG: hypothetical protein NTX29_10060, partial [Actinobacteria bacterium]|nr:hypothetical protein [Actinomycetota bacterium]
MPPQPEPSIKDLVSKTVADAQRLAKAQAALQGAIREIGAKELLAMDGIAKLSVVGIGMRSHSGVA